MSDSAYQTLLEKEEVIANPERKGIRKGLYLIPTAFTAANVLMGFLSLMSTMRGFQLLGIGNGDALLKAASLEFDKASIFIGWAILFDSLDGRLARMTKTTTEIGVQFDSIADVLTFGIAPAFLAFAWGYGSSLQSGSTLYSIGLFVSFMYLMCGAFRLARFNVQASRPRPLIEGTVKVDKKHFVGLPIPPAAGLLAAVVHFTPMPLVFYGAEKSRWLCILLMLGMGLLGLLMVSTIRYTSFKSLGTGRNNIRLILLIAAISMLIWLYSKYVLLIAVVVYVAHGIVLKMLSSLFGGLWKDSGRSHSEN
jgi:CDP-diacylglycerol--serine O-phosphatidyltransferase